MDGDLNDQLLMQIKLHLRDVLRLAAMIKRGPATDDDWAIIRAMNNVSEAEVIFRSVRRSTCTHSSQESSSAG